MRAARDKTLKLPLEQQQLVVERHNRNNPKKPPVDLGVFLETLNRDVQVAEAPLDRERREALHSQKRKLYSAQPVQTFKLFTGAVAFVLPWRRIQWARPGARRRCARNF